MALRGEVHDVIRGESPNVPRVQRRRLKHSHYLLQGETGSEAARDKDGLCNERTPAVAHGPSTAHRVKQSVRGKGPLGVNVRAKRRQRHAACARQLARNDRWSAKVPSQMCRRFELVEVAFRVALRQKTRLVLTNIAAQPLCNLNVRQGFRARQEGWSGWLQRCL